MCAVALSASFLSCLCFACLGACGGQDAHERPLSPPDSREANVPPGPSPIEILRAEARARRDEAVGGGNVGIAPDAPACVADPSAVAAVRAAIERWSATFHREPEPHELTLGCPDAQGTVIATSASYGGVWRFAADGTLFALTVNNRTMTERDAFEVDLTGDGVVERVVRLELRIDRRSVFQWLVVGTPWGRRVIFDSEVDADDTARPRVLYANGSAAIEREGRLFAFDASPEAMHEVADPAPFLAVREARVRAERAEPAFAEIEATLALATGDCDSPRRAEWIAQVESRLVALGTDRARASALALAVGSCGSRAPAAAPRVSFVPASAGTRAERFAALNEELGATGARDVNAYNSDPHRLAFVSAVTGEGPSETGRVWIVTDQASVEFPSDAVTTRHRRTGATIVRRPRIDGYTVRPFERPAAVVEGNTLLGVVRASERGASLVATTCERSTARVVTPSVCGTAIGCGADSAFVAVDRNGVLASVDRCLDAIEAIRAEALVPLARVRAERAALEAESRACETSESDAAAARTAIARASGETSIDQVPGLARARVYCPNARGAGLVRVDSDDDIVYWVVAGGAAQEIFSFGSDTVESVAIDVDVTGDGVPDRLVMTSIEIDEDAHTVESWHALSPDWRREIAITTADFSVVRGETRAGLLTGDSVWAFDASGTLARTDDGFGPVLETFDAELQYSTYFDSVLEALRGPDLTTLPCDDPRRTAWAARVEEDLTGLDIAAERARVLAAAAIACN